MATARAQEIRTGLARLHAVDPVLAELIDARPDFDPDAWSGHCPQWTCSARWSFRS
jgi:hypothetical protein